MTTTRKNHVLLTMQRARRASAPIVAISTADPADTMRRIVEDEDCNDGGSFVKWNCASGFDNINPSGEEVLNGMTEQQKAGTNPAKALSFFLANCGENAVLFVHQGNRWVDSGASPNVAPVFIQELWNARDRLKSCSSMIIFVRC